MTWCHEDLNLIQNATALPTVTVGPVKPSAAITADVSGFALALGALMPKIAAPSAGQPVKPGDAAILLPGRQDVAEGGKELPDAVLGLEGHAEDQPGAEKDSGDADTDAEDAPPPPFVWFAAAPTAAAEPEIKAEAAPTVTIEGSGKRRAQPQAALPEMSGTEAADAPVSVKTAGADVASKAAASPPPIPNPQASVQPVPRPGAVATPVSAPAIAAAPASAPRTAPADPAIEAAAATAVTTTTAGAPEHAGPASQAPVAQAPRELRQAAADAPVVRIAIERPVTPQKLSIADVAPQAAAIASPSVADQIFAAFDRPRGQGGANSPGDTQSALSTLAAPATGTQTLSAVAATGQAQDTPLDTQHQQWTAKMLDRIEALRDAAPVRETKISLMPEGLGKVDIAIRQDDAGLHVAFNTDTQSARQLIADAQPKLAEIAQERGIRIGSTSVESNATGSGAGNGTTSSQMNQGHRQDAQPQRNQPSAPPGARREAPTSTHDDERVA